MKDDQSKWCNKMKTWIKENKYLVAGGVVAVITALVLGKMIFSGGDTSANFGQGNNFSGANVNQSKTNTVTTKVETNKEKK